MVRTVEFKENLSQEEIDSLAAVLLDDMKKFYDKEQNEQQSDEQQHWTDNKGAA